MGKQCTVETIADGLTGHRVMARPVVPIRIRGSVVRVDVARTIVAAVIDVSTATDSPDHVGINEVGVKGGRPPRMCTAIPYFMDEIIAESL